MSEPIYSMFKDFEYYEKTYGNSEVLHCVSDKMLENVKPHDIIRLDFCGDLIWSAYVDVVDRKSKFITYTII